jgi:hypothetical protein
MTFFILAYDFQDPFGMEEKHGIFGGFHPFSCKTIWNVGLNPIKSFEISMKCIPP